MKTKKQIDESKIARGQIKYVIKLMEMARDTQKQKDIKEEIEWLKSNRDIINGIDVLDVDKRLQKLNEQKE